MTRRRGLSCFSSSKFGSRPWDDARYRRFVGQGVYVVNDSVEHALELQPLEVEFQGDACAFGQPCLMNRDRQMSKNQRQPHEEQSPSRVARASAYRRLPHMTNARLDAKPSDGVAQAQSVWLSRGVHVRNRSPRSM